MIEGSLKKCWLFHSIKDTQLRTKSEKWDVVTTQGASPARGEGPYHDGQCAQCPMKFSTWEEHSQHIAQVHKGVFMHACGYCGINSFNTEEEKICHKYFCRISKAPRAMRQVEVGSAQCTECDQVIQHASQRKARSHFLEYHSHLAQKCEICRSGHSYKKNSKFFLVGSS